jgi:hypothetical protein
MREVPTLLLAGTLMAACTITPRSSPPAKVWDIPLDLQETSDCVVARLDKAMNRGQAPKITHKVDVIEGGKVLEIHATPHLDGEYYFVRLTAADKDQTKVELWSVLGKIKQQTNKALSPCVRH